ncbi:MAG: hypothetical protein J6P58_00965 [Oscillospiraceae bacterium]|nr:hypothetical protein [Oscillospiraceae bacterium]
MSVILAIVDFVPVVIFLVSAILLQRGLYNKMSKGAFALLSTGTIMVFIAGLYKATWKLLYAAGICDFEKLNLSFMPMQGTGFLLAALAIIAMFLAKQETKDEPLYAAAAPAVFSGTMIFVSFMCLGIIAIGSGMSVIAKRMNQKKAIPFFLVSIVGMLMMGYLSSKDFASPALNWVAEIVNIVAQGSLLTGLVMLSKAGLKDFRLNTKE